MYSIKGNRLCNTCGLNYIHNILQQKFASINFEIKGQQWHENKSSLLIFTKQVQREVIKIAETHNLISTETHFYLLNVLEPK